MGERDYLVDCGNIPTELTIKIKEKTFPVHKLILIMRSPYFRKMLGSSFKEGNVNTISLEETSADIFHEFLNLIYECPYVSSLNLMMMVDMYGVKGVTLDSIHEKFMVDVEDYKTYIETCTLIYPSPLPSHVIDIIASKITTVAHFQYLPDIIKERMMMSTRMCVPRLCEYVIIRGMNKGKICERQTEKRDEKYCLACKFKLNM
jgi:hypothetical protein